MDFFAPFKLCSAFKKGSGNKMGRPTTSRRASREPIFYTALAVFTAWVILVSFSANWAITQVYEEKIALATSEAKANWFKDQAFRAWATRHGGVYVKTDDRTPPNPYLSHLKHRDIITTDGTKLTLMNPAYMMRQMTDEFEETYGIKGNITGKVTLNPINKADHWELRALDAFENGAVDLVEQQDIDGKPHLRYMKRMIMTEGCEKCHGHLGFKLGDLRGGVSVSIPLQPYFDVAESTTRSIIITHTIVFLIGCAALAIYIMTGLRRDRERHAFSLALEQRVIDRTDDLIKKEKEIKASEQRLQQILDTAVDAIITIDERGNIESFNNAAEDMFGYSEKEIAGNNVKVLMAENDQKIHDKALSDYLQTGKAKIIGVGREVKAQHKDGHTFPAELAVSEINTEHGKQYIGMLHNISIRKDFENELIESRASAEIANRAKTEFLASMSHELRTPLNAILGFGQILKKYNTEPLTERQNKGVDRIISAGEHLLDIINEILDLSTVEAGKMVFFPINVSVKNLLDEMFDLTENMAIDHKIQLIKNYEEIPNVEIFADFVRIKQVILNLISNAIKYNTENGKVTINYEHKQDVVRINVTDTGKGIAPEKQEALFHPFNRLGAEKGQIQGTGIGLSLSKKLIEMMGGCIGLNSTEGEGSTFWLEIPTYQGKKSTDLDEKEKEASKQFDTKSAGTVLYVEDTPSNIELMEMIVQDLLGMTLISAPSAELGIEIARTQKPDLIILDINLPGMNGFAAREQLATMQQTKDIPIIALSASASKADIEKGLSEGFKHYMTKPIEVVAFAEVIKKVVGIEPGD